MAQQTAVDWLFDELMKNYAMNYSIAKQINREAQIWAQAKQMMKEQITNAYEHGQNNGYMYRDGASDIINEEHYYNETYGKQ